MTNTRVHHAVQQIDQQVDEDNHRRHQQYAALHYRIVAALQCVNQPASQTGPREDGFGQNRPASNVPTCRPITVTTGSIALRSAWTIITRMRVSPLARAVRM